MARDFPNQQWKWLIVDIEDGSVTGTDDDKAAAEFARSEQNIVIERNTCQIYAGYNGYNAAVDSNGDYFPDVENIREQTVYKFD